MTLVQLFSMIESPSYFKSDLGTEVVSWNSTDAFIQIQGSANFRAKSDYFPELARLALCTLHPHRYLVPFRCLWANWQYQSRAASLGTKEKTRSLRLRERPLG